MIENLFASQIWKSSPNIENSIKSKILSNIEEVYKKTTPQFDNCNVYTDFVGQSTIDYSKIIFYFKEEYEKFSREINLCLHEYILDETWFNYYSKGCNQEYHDHLSSQRCSLYSMVYFLKLNDDHPKITFHNYTNLHAIFTTNSKIKKVYRDKDIKHSITRPYWNLNIKEGDLIIFPSYLFHGVFVQKTNDPRITISSNIYLL